jgi:hypothetical protein
MERATVLPLAPMVATFPSVEGNNAKSVDAQNRW